MSGNNTLIFVYGTLMQGLRNHHLLKDEKLICDKTHSQQKADLIVLYDRPYMQLNSEGVQIKGELYEVSDSALTRLDELEDHPKWYIRKSIHVFSKTLDQTIEAFVYLIQDAPETKFGEVYKEGCFQTYMKDYSGPCANDFIYKDGKLIPVNS